jgi:tRNA(His) guanylyltransferase
MNKPKDSLGDRMKGYEQCYKPVLTHRSPVIIRLDGKAFHTFTRGMDKPFDQHMINAMAESAQYVASNIQGFKMGYVQSDEVSLLLTDYDNIDTEGWFDYELNKIVSISASLMTTSFKNFYPDKMPVFDARCFVLPRDEVANYFLWRAKDWGRNSIQMLSQSHFSSKILHRKKTADMHELLHSKGINWNDLSTQLKNGTWITKDKETEFDVLPNYESIDKFITENL